MDRQDTGGVSTLLALLTREAGGAEVEGQDDLFEADAPTPLEPRGKSGPKGGRPKGARNRSTEEWRAYFLAQYRSPMTVLAELYSRDVGELTDHLQGIADKHAITRVTESGVSQHKVLVSPMDVLRLQRDAATALLPYLHKKQPMAIEVEERQRGILLIGDLATGGVADDLALPLAPEVEENQGLIASSDAKSDERQSDG